MWATNLKIVGIVLGTLALYTLIANKIPQVQSEVPQALTLGANVTPEQLVAAGQKVYTGIGGCTTCHGLGERAPNLLTDEKGQGPIGARCGKREPEKTCKQYLYESLDNPTAYVVSRRNAESIRKKILDPASSVTKGYEKLAGIMPKTFGTMMSAAQLEALVQYLAAHK